MSYAEPADVQYGRQLSVMAGWYRSLHMKIKTARKRYDALEEERGSSEDAVTH